MMKRYWKWFALSAGLAIIVIAQGCSSQKSGSSSQSSQTFVEGCATITQYASPQTIGEAVELINASPKPLTVGCFINKLAKPLQVNMTDSTFSAQPAAGETNPRVFIKSGNLLISIVTKGAGSEVIEFGELQGDTSTIKGELDFPITGPIAVDAPFTKIRNVAGTGTNCAGCHNTELPALQYTGAFVSTAFKPSVGTNVNINFILREWVNCDRTNEADRCQILDAMYGDQSPVHFDFPALMPTF